MHDYTFTIDIKIYYIVCFLHSVMVKAWVAGPDDLVLECWLCHLLTWAGGLTILYNGANNSSYLRGLLRRVSEYKQSI